MRPLRGVEDACFCSCGDEFGQEQPTDGDGVLELHAYVCCDARLRVTRLLPRSELVVTTVLPILYSTVSTAR